MTSNQQQEFLNGLDKSSDELVAKDSACKG